MPQMSPLNWIMMFFTFILLMIFIMILLFFIFQPIQKKNCHKKKISNSMNWKW